MGWIMNIFGGNKQDAQAHFRRGLAFETKGKLNKAISAYRQAVRISPQYTEAYNNLGNALQGKGMFDEAIAAYRQAVQINPQFAEL